MKQILCRILVLLVVVAAILGLSSCNIFIEQDVTFYDLIVNDFDREVVYGSELDFSGLEIEATTGDDVKYIPVNSSMIVSGDTKTVGVHELEIEYGGFSWTLAYEVFYKVEHIVDGLVYDSQLVSSRDEILYVKDPVKNGSIFLGWSTDMPETLTGNVRREAVFVDNITLPKLSATYGDTLGDITLPTVSGGKWHWQDSAETSVGNAGTNVFKLVYVFDDTTKGELTFDVDVEVAKKHVDIKVLDEVFEYNGKVNTVRYELSEAVPAEDVICFGDIAGTEIGEYSYTIRIFNDNYEGQYSGTFEIEPIDITIAILLLDPSDGVYKSEVIIDYGNSFPEYKIVITDKNGNDYKLDAELSVSKPVLLKAGEHPVTTSFDDEHYDPKIIGATLKVNTVDLDPGVPGLIGAENVVFGDKLSEILFEEHQLGYWEWDLSHGDTVGNAGKNTFTAVFVPKDSSYNEYRYDVELTVNRKQLTFDITSSRTFVFDGKEYGLTYNVIDPNSREVVSGLKVLGNQKFVNAGTHSVTLEFEDKNYQAIENTFTFTISQATIEKDFSFIVDDVWFQGITLSDIPLPEGYKWNNPGIQIGEPGGYSYDATFYPEDQNYATVSGSLAIVLDKATPSLTTDKKAYDSLIYNTSEHKLSGVITHNSNSDMRNNIEYYISGTDEQITGLTNAGTYNIDVVVPESNKYKSAKVSVVVVVNKANPSIDRPVIDGWTFGDEADEPTSGSKQVEIAGFHYYTEECGQYTKLDGVPTNAGTYYVTAYSLATDNYNAAESDYRQFVIEKFVVTRPTLAHDVYTGGTLSATVPASTLYKVSENGNPARMNAGTYEVTLELLDSDNYIWNNGDKLTTKVSYVIDKATINLSAITGSNSFKYDDAFDFVSEKTYTTEHVTNFGEVVYLYATINNPTVFTEVVPENIGTYLVKAVVYADEANNWKTVETAPFRFEITKKPIPVPELSETTSVFNGDVFKPTAPENEEIYTIEYENENSINKGEYKVTFTIIDQNYKWADGANGERTYTITAATPEIYDVVSGGWTFGTPITHSASAKVTADGHEDYLINVENAVRVVYYNTSNKNVPINKPSNAGTYYVRFVVSADNNNGNWVSTSSDYIEFVIEQFALDIPELDGTGVYTFTGSDIPLTVKENNAHKAHYTVSGNVERNVGSYTAVYSLENSNYKWNDETTSDKTIDYKIQQAGSSVTGLAITPWTFNDAANIPVYTAKTSTGYTIPVGQISISFRKADSDSWTTISPSEWATKGPHYAGDYYVKVSVASDENNNWATSESAEFKLNIAKDDYDMSGVSWNYTGPFTFNDGDHTVSVTGTLPSGVSVKEYTGNVEENAGTYTANVKFSYDYDNYNEPTLASLEWTINPQIVNKPEADTTEFVYNTTEQKYVLATHSGYTISGNLQTNAGTYEVVVTLNNTETVKNYIWNDELGDEKYTAKTYDFVISPKALETTFVTLANTLEYNETAQTQTVLVKFGKEELVLDEDYFVTGNVQTDAGENYKLTVTAKAGSNYTGSVDIPYTVARKPIPKPSAATGLEFNNGTLGSGIYTIEGQWTAVDTAEAATVNGVTPAGDYKVTVTLNSNYKWNDGSITPLELPYKIDKATIKLTNLTAQYPEGASSWTFGDTIAYKATSDKTFVESEIKYLYSKTMNGTYTEDFIFDKAGTYYVKAQVNAGDNWYESNIIGPISFTINPRPVPVLSVNTIPVYAQGTTYELVDILNNFDGRIMSFAEGSVTSSDVAGGFNAKVVLDSNYVWESTFDGNISWSVSKAPASITIENATFNKDYRVEGYSIYDIVSGIAGSHSEVDLDYSIKTFGDANTYTVTVTLAESDNYFAAESKDITIIINPIDTPDVISGLVATYGDLLSSVSLETYDDYGTWEWIETSGTTVGEVGERTFKAKFTPYTNKSGTSNYKAISEKPLTVTVGQKGIFVPYVTAGQTFTYKLHDDDKNHTPNLTIPTLVEGDEAVNVYRIEGLTNSTAKTHEVIVTLINDNYKWNDGAEGTTRTFTYTINPYKITIPKVEDKPYADGADINSGLGSGVSGEYTVEDDPVGTTAGELLTVVLKLVDSSNTEWYNFYNVTNAVVYGDNSEYVKITYKIATATNEWVNGKEPAIDAEMTYGTATVDRPEVLYGGVRMEYKLKTATLWIEIPEGGNLPADLPVGEYHIRFTSTDTSATEKTETLDFEITPAPASITVTNGLGTGGIYLDGGYDLSKITAKATANVGGAEIDVAIYLNGEKVESLGTVYAVDTYEVVFKLANDNYSAAEQSVTVEITKAPLNIPVIGDLDYKEVTENQKPVVELDFDESLVEITNNGGINVVDGGYTVVIKLTADAYEKYEWNTVNKPVNASIDGDTVTITYMIKKVTNSFTYADGYNADEPLYVENWTYDNEANLPVGITGSAFGEVKYQYYKLNTETGKYETVDIEDVKHAGDYKVVAYVEANGNNYDRIESLPAYFEIKVRTITPPTFSLPEGQDKFVFVEDTVHNPSVTESADSEYYSYTFGNEGNDDAGTYSVIVSINEEHVGSVVWAENAITDFPYTVDKAPVPIPDLTNSIVYTGSAINGTYAPNNLYSEVVAERVSATDAGEVGSLTFELNDPNNFRWENDLTVENGLTGTEVTTTKTFTVTPAPVSVPVVSASRVFNNDAQTSGWVTELNKWSVDDNGVTESGVTPVGDYTAVITLNSNYQWNAIPEGVTNVRFDENDNQVVYVTYSITEKSFADNDITVSHNYTDLTYGDSLDGKKVTVKFGDTELKDEDFEVIFGGKSTTVGDAGTYTVTVKGIGNYTGEKSGANFTISVANAQFSITDGEKESWNTSFGSVKSEAPSPKVFLENNKSFVVEDASIKVYYKLQTEVAVAAFSVEEDPWAGWTLWTAENYPSAVGKYYIAVVVETDKASNYNEYSETFEIQILKADTSIVGVPTLSNSNGTSNYKFGTYEGPSTREDLLSGVSVKRGDGTVVVTPSIEIDFDPYVTDTAWDGTIGLAGSYTITYSYAGDDSHNAATDVVCYVTIEKAYTTISGVTNGQVIDRSYNEQNHLPNVTINGNTATPAIVYTAPAGYEGTVPENGKTAGTYVLTYSFAGDNNYEPMTNDVVVTLNIAQVEQIVTESTITKEETIIYGNNALDVIHLPTNVTGGEWKLYNSDKTTLATTVDNATNEGEYNIFYARFKSNNVNYASTDFIEVKISVAKAPIEIKVPTIADSDFNFIFTFEDSNYVDSVKSAIKYTETNGLVTWGGATTIIDKGEYELTLTIGEGSNHLGATETIKVKVNPASISAVLGSDLTYIGTAEGATEQTQTITVIGVAKDTDFKLGTDYEVTSLKATVVGTYNVTVTGKGNYEGAVWTGSYQVLTKYVTAPSWPNDTQLQYTFGDTFTTPEPTNYVDLDYYTVTGPASSTNAGTYTYTVTLDTETHGDNIAWAEGTIVNANKQVELSYVINPKALADGNVIVSDVTYDGNEHRATVKDGETLLVKDTDYEITYSTSDFTSAGKITVTVTGIGNYSGEIEKTYEIKKKALTNDDVILYNQDGETVHTPTNITYNGSEQKPTVTVSGLTLDKDYTVTYKRGGAETNDFANAGTITVTVTGTGNYTGTIEKTYKINKAKAKLTYKANNGEYYRGSEYSFGELFTISATNTIDEVGITTTIDNYKFELLDKDGTYKEATGILNAGTYSVKIHLVHQNYETNAPIEAEVTINKISAETLLRKKITENEWYFESGLASIVNDASITWKITTNFVGGTARFVVNIGEENVNYISGTFDITLKLKFYTVAKFNNTSYGSIENALKAAEESGGGTVWVMPIESLKSQNPNLKGTVAIPISQNCVVPGGVTLLLPYGPDDGDYNKSSDSGSYSSTNGAPTITDNKVYAETNAATNLKTLVVVKEGVTITVNVNGKILVAGQISAAGSGAEHTGHTGGAYAELRMEKNASIICSGTIESYGYITEVENGRSFVTIKNGGKLYQPLVILDFRGGSYTKNVGTSDKLQMSPLSEFIFRNVQSVLTIEYGAAMYVSANFRATLLINTQTIGMDVQLVGNTSSQLLQMIEGSKIIVNYNGIVNGQENISIDMHGGGKINALQLSKSGFTVNTVNAFLPFSYLFDITLHNGSYSSDNQHRFHLMWGNKFTLDNATLVIDELYIARGEVKYDIEAGAANYYPVSTDAIFTLTNGSKLIVDSIAGEVRSGSIGNMVIINLATTSTVHGISNTGTTPYKDPESFMTSHPDTIRLVKADGSELTEVNLGTMMFYNGSTWVTDMIRIEYDAAGGNVEEAITAATTTTTSDGKYSFTIPELATPEERLGYTFNGWYTGKNGTGDKLEKDDTYVHNTRELVIYAYWTKDEYTLSFDNTFKDSEITSDDDVTFYIDSDISLPEHSEVTIGDKTYVFLGWYTSSDFAADSKVTEITARELIESMVSGSTSKVLYGRWTDVTFTFVYDGSEGDIYANHYDGVVVDNVLTAADLEGSTNLPIIDGFYKTSTDKQYYFGSYQVLINGKWEDLGEDETTYQSILKKLGITEESTSTVIKIRIKSNKKFEVTINYGLSDLDSSIPKLSGDAYATTSGFLVYDEAKNQSLPISSPFAGDNNPEIGWYFDGWTVNGNLKIIVEEGGKYYIQLTDESTGSGSVTGTWGNKAKITITVTHSNDKEDSADANITIKFYDSDKSVYKDSTGNEITWSFSKAHDAGTEGGTCYLIPGHYYSYSGSDYSENLSKDKTQITSDGVEISLKTNTKDDSCLVEGTLITMADGTVKAVEDLVVGDMIMIFNHVTGKFEAMPLIFNTHADALEADYYDVLYLNFSDGRELKIVQSHGLFDLTLMQYVYITNDNYQDYIGHEFYALNSNGTDGERITLTDAFIRNEKVRIFCPVTYFHMNSFANGILNTPNIPGDITGLVNYFEYDDDLKYNEEKMQADIEKYGLYTYDDFKDYISEAAYNSSPAVYLKVAVGKGMITFEEILDVIDYLLSGSLIQ